MTAVKKLTLKRLKTILRYNPSTGEFIWRGHISSHVKADKVAGVERQGYIFVHVDWQVYRAHRLAWFYMIGRWPKSDIDHRDLDGMNNRWSNLRIATRSQNKCNGRAHKDSKSGVKGVSLAKGRRKFAAHIRANGKNIYLGSFENINDAAAAYARGAKKYHGEFARVA